LFLFLVCLWTITIQADQPCGNVAEIPLLAGQTIDVGFMTVSNNQNSLIIVYHAENGWTITETHLAVATSLAGIPQTKKGNPIPGQFPYYTSHSPGVTEVVHVVNSNAWPTGTRLYIAAHAVVVSGGSNETAWGDGLDFPGNNWATYFNYDVQPCIFSPGILQFGNAVYTVDESGVKAFIEIVRTDGSDGTVSVDFNTSDQTATAGSDYVPVSTTLVFAPGETSRIVEIPILDDLAVEGNETLDLVLSNVVGATLGDQNSAVLTIRDNDTLPPSPGILRLSDTQYFFNEKDFDQTIYITVIRTDGSDGEVSVKYTITEDTAWETIDYDGDFSGTLVFADGETEKTIELTLIGDNLKELNEIFSVSLSNVVGAVLGEPYEATATIKDDDGIIPE